MADGVIAYRTNCSQAGIDVFLASGQGLPGFRIFDSNNNLLFSFDTNGTIEGSQLTIIATDRNVGGAIARFNAPPNTFAQTPVFDFVSNRDASGNAITELQILTEGTLIWFGALVGGALANMAKILVDWADANVATRHSEFKFQTHGTGGYTTALQLGATGALTPTLGALGAPDVPQQPTASAAGIAGIRTDTLAHAVADIQTILTALRAWAVTMGFTNNTA